VWIHGSDGSKGTGWVQDRARRRIVTAHHVVGDGNTVEVFIPTAANEQAHYLEHRERLRREGSVVRGRVIRRSPEMDLALVEVESLAEGTTALPLARSSARPGDRVHLVGNRYDTPVLWTYSSGTILQSQVLKEGYFCAGEQLAKGARVVTAQVPINEGDSGGALLNDRGEVVGVAAAVAWDVQGAGLFIDLPLLRAFLEEAPPEEGGGNEAGREVYRKGVAGLALVEGGDATAFASGCLIDRDRRLLLTTAEVLGRKETAIVTFPVYQGGEPVSEAAFYKANEDLLKRKGCRVRGCVLLTDQRRNLAMLELDSVPAEARAVPLAAAGPVPGQVVHVLGSPRRTAFRWAYAAAGVRQVGRVNLGLFSGPGDAAVLLLQAVLGEGEGGGPVLDNNGRLVGIVTGKSAPQQQISYALTRSEIEDFLTAARPLRQPRTAEELALRAEQFRKARHYERALRDLSEAVRLAPKSAAMHAERGRMLAALGRTEEALTECNEALRLDPRCTAALCVRGQVWCLRGDTARALIDADTALKQDHRLAAALAVRAHAKLLRGDLDGAIADADEAIWLDRYLPEALTYRGRAYTQKRAFERAIDDFTRALGLRPSDAEVHRRRGEAHWGRGDVAAALEDFTAALALDPKDAAAACGQGRCFAAQGDHGRARAAFQETLRMSPDCAPAWLGRGTEQLHRGRSTEAFADFAECLKRQPSLASEILAAVEARATALTDDPEPCIAVCRSGLEVVRTAISAHTEAERCLARALAAARAEPDPRRRAANLRAAVADVRERLGE
jgi:tetratricopeptide (TPR) repeat protein